MLPFRRKAPPLFGLDISSTAVKLLELGREGDHYRIESYAVQPLPPNSVVEKNITDVEAVGSAIKNAIASSKTRAKHAAVAVAGSAVITKVITMPAHLSEREMEAQIQIEADKYIPYPLEEVNLDFEIQGVTENDGDLLDVLLAASRSENVELRVAAVELGGATAQIVDVEAYALENAYALLNLESLTSNDSIVAVVDIGATMTTLNVLRSGKIIYTREQVFGGKQLTEEIMRRFGLTYEEAGLAKRHGGLPSNYQADVLDPFLLSMTQQINRALQFFFSSSQYNAVEHILLAGGCAAIKGVEQVVGRELHNTPTTIVQPFENMVIGRNVNQKALLADSSALMIACGLALRNFD